MAKIIAIFLFGLFSQAPSLLCKFFRISNGGGWSTPCLSGTQVQHRDLGHIPVTWLPSDSETPISRRPKALAEGSRRVHDCHGLFSLVLLATSVDQYLFIKQWATAGLVC